MSTYYEIDKLYSRGRSPMCLADEPMMGSWVNMSKTSKFANNVLHPGSSSFTCV